MTAKLPRFLAMGTLALLAVSSACSAQTPNTAAPTRPYVIVANQRSGVATLLEIESGRISHVDLDANPHEVAVSPDARVAVLTVPSNRFTSSRSVIVLDVTTARVARTIDLGHYKEPHGIAFISDSVALIGTLGGTSVAFVDVRNGRVLRAVNGLPANPYVIALTSTGRAYVSSPHSSKVSEIDIATGKVLRTIHIDDDPAGIAVSSDGKELYAAVWRQNTGGGIVIYDLERGVVSAKLPATQPRRMTVTADGKFLVVSDNDNIRIVDRATRQTRSVALERNAFGSGVDCSPDSSKCYVSFSKSAEIVEVDIIAARILRRFKGQQGLDGVAYVPR